MRILSYLLVTSLVGCTSFVATDTTETELQRDIRAGGVVVIGDEVRITTRAQDIVEMTVVDITDQAIVGEAQSVAIDDVAELKVRTFSKGRTAALVGGSAGTVILVLVLLLSSMAFFP